MMCLVQLKAATWWEVCFFEADVIRCLVRISWVRGIARISGGLAGEDEYGGAIWGISLYYFKNVDRVFCGFDFGLKGRFGSGLWIVGYGLVMLG